MIVPAHETSRRMTDASSRGSTGSLRTEPIRNAAAVPAAAPVPADARRTEHGYLPVLLIGAVSLLLFDRLLSFTLSNAVNILFWDQWDFYTPFFEHASLWRIFAWQHGPPRLGVGSVVTWVIAGLTHWNARSEALAMVGIVSIATPLAVWLKRRLFGSVGVIDVVIPLLFLSRAQHEMLVGATDLAHGPFPLLLTVLICLAWIQPNRPVRYGLVVALNFLTIFTGFGLFMGLITLPLLAFDGYRAWRDKQRGALVGSAVAFAIALVSLASFFIGYVFAPGAEGFHFPYANVLAYPAYAALMFANVFGLKAVEPVSAYLVGFALLACVVVVLIHHLKLMAKGGAAAEPTSRIVVILLGYSLLFSLGAAIGRVHLGTNSADSSRYYLYLTIGILGLYFHLLTLKRAAPRKWGLTVCLLGALVAGFRLSPLDERSVSRLSHGKRSWKACYLRTEDIQGCDRAAEFVLYPRPEETHLREKLDYLKRHKLNLYAPDP